MLVDNEGQDIENDGSVKGDFQEKDVTAAEALIKTEDEDEDTHGPVKEDIGETRGS